MLSDGRIQMLDLRQALGRMVFVYGAIRWDMPFLSVLFTFLHTHAPGACVQLPLYVQMVLRWLRGRLRARRTLPCARPLRRLGGLFRVDAKADKDEVAIGGWMPRKDAAGSISVSESPWFAISLSEENAPWAFSKGQAYKTISSLELFASLIATMVFDPAPSVDGALRVGTISVSGFTDSQVAAKVLARGMSTSYPLCLVTMELAAQLERRGLDLELEWLPRDANKEADALSNLLFDEFDAGHRISVSLADLPWLVLPDLLKQGEEIFAARSQRPSPEAAPICAATRKRSVSAESTPVKGIGQRCATETG